MDAPETRYARSGDARIAYQVFGRGDVPIVLVPPVINHIDLDWEEPSVARFLERLGTFGRVVSFDKRGQGLSDRMDGVPTLEERVDDIGVVMDAAGFERAALWGASEGGLMAMVFAATYPQRVNSLFLFGTAPRFGWAEDHPYGPVPEVSTALLEAWADVWGTPESPSAAMFAQSRIGDAAFRKWLSRLERSSCSPSTFLRTMRLNLEYDIRALVPTVQTPTLLMHRTNDPLVAVENSRWLVEHLPNARFVELPGVDHAPHFGPDLGVILDEAEAFITGSVGATDVDRVLATVLFTDLVGSTERAVALGDETWRDLLDRFDDLTARAVTRHRGRVVNHTGDGHLATFDGPGRAIKCAQELAREVRRELGIDIRAGLHTGEVELRADNMSGIAVHLAARVAAIATAGQVLVSRTVTDLVAGSGLSFTDAGSHVMKGVPGEWQLFAVAA
jgi:class 3 adenylate cyclase